jgi:anthranilate phosphoribosyltransferase
VSESGPEQSEQPEQGGGRRRRSGDPQACLAWVAGGRDLSAEESRALFDRIMSGEVSPTLIGSLLAALATKGETPDEIAGAARVMRERSARVVTRRAPLVDTCGTGGDGARTFNISTAAAFVVAAAGVGVAKHGNRAASSRCGSADVLEAAGVVIDLPSEAVGRCIDEAGIGFLFAPRFHPATRHAVGPRREIGIRTVFNLLGPLTNPAAARRQVIGVPDRSLVEPMATVLRDLGCDHALVVHGEDGLDEVSVAGRTMVAEVRGADVALRTVTPAELGLETFPVDALAGGDAAENTRILRAVLEGRGTAAQAASVAATAGAALYVAGASGAWPEGVARARAILAAGEGAAVLDALVVTTRSFGA